MIKYTMTNDSKMVQRHRDYNSIKMMMLRKHVDDAFTYTYTQKMISGNIKINIFEFEPDWKIKCPDL